MERTGKEKIRKRKGWRKGRGGANTEEEEGGKDEGNREVRKLRRNERSKREGRRRRAERGR